MGVNNSDAKYKICSTCKYWQPGDGCAIHAWGQLTDFLPKSLRDCDDWEICNQTIIKTNQEE